MPERPSEIAHVPELGDDAFGLAHDKFIRSKRIRCQRGKRIDARRKVRVMEKPITLRLKELRERADVSMDALAKAAGYAGASSYQRYEDPALFLKPYLPLQLVMAIAPALAGKGEPPVTADEVYALARAIPPGPLQEIDREMQMVDPAKHRAIWDLLLSVVKSHKSDIKP